MSIKTIIKKDSSAYFLLKSLKMTYLYRKIQKMDSAQKMAYVSGLYRKK